MLITSELTNQSAQKALFTCVVYTNSTDTQGFHLGFQQEGNWFPLAHKTFGTECLYKKNFPQDGQIKLAKNRYNVHIQGRQKLASRPINLSSAWPLMKQVSPKNLKFADCAVVANTEH